MRRLQIRVVVPVLALLGGGALRGGEIVRVAAASNLTYALDALDGVFAEAHPDDRVTPVMGASGSLEAQIVNGAPFDVFLSADAEHARKLVEQGAGERASLTTFALGRLVLWSAVDKIGEPSVRDTVNSPGVRRLAIANPATAPFGRAARQVLERLKLDAVAEPKLVMGENIAQTAQYVQTGNADAGFVALSLLMAPGHRMPGRWISISPGLYDPLPQVAVLTIRGARSPLAHVYLAFLVSPAAREILQRYGYGLPP